MDARLEGANLAAEQLDKVNVADGVNLEGAVADEGTGWPDAFDWRAAGVIVMGKDASSP